ncbi:MAG: DEAD/DEAH box helicase, partial [Chloroflexi bacterium]|nr:DEAD/DEAH box helicase [Chloroflexota bacterium]
GEVGFFAIDDGTLWDSDADELPDFWFEERKAGPRIRERYTMHVPRPYSILPDGALSNADNQTGEVVRGWFQPSPLMICLRCRAAYGLREGDYRKLASLSQTGRSTATTVVVNAAVSGMSAQGVPRNEAKVLSFTDNRQDASLQAGHLNDFVQVAELRAAIVNAIARHGALRFQGLGESIFDAMDPRPEDFLREPVASGPGYQRGRRAMIELLEYRALEDLSRGWRIVQPNLEQAGVLRIEYGGLHELASDDARWQGIPVISAATSDLREMVLRAFLDHLRMQLAIDASALTEQSTRQLTRNTGQWLRDPWAFEERDRLRTQSIALLPDIRRADVEFGMRTFSLGTRSTFARYVRSGRTWGIDDNLSTTDVESVVNGIVEQLRGHILSVEVRGNQDIGVRVLADVLRWAPGNGQAAGPDPVRAPALYLRRQIGEQEPNRYFSNLYQQNTSQLRGMLAREHTGQVRGEDRETRERQFREGELPALFCSPTMELGVDISDLHMVHMRNIPPTPANYAQRSGRAGRNGRPAFIAAFSAQGNVHDQYFFRRRNEMIAGAVAPARMDLRNRELVEAHLHSMWLAIVGVTLGNDMVNILDLDNADYPVLTERWAEIENESHISEAITAAREIILRAPEVRDSWWYIDEWVEATIRNAPRDFNLAFDRWRELYRTACAQRDTARRVFDSPRTVRREREEAEQRVRESSREIDLLLNRTRRLEDSDFYPYRYLASEGFLPGYNFPRLPVRALVTVGNDSHLIDRYRFLGLTEFGPGSIIYHEGRKHRIDAVVMPPNGIADRLSRARLCNMCGYAHDESAIDVDMCEHCGTRLDAANSEFPQRLLDQPTMRARPSERVSSDEEERTRSGFRITTHFRFSPGVHIRNVQVVDEAGESLLAVVYAPSATVWRINHGWRRGLL